MAFHVVVSEMIFTRNNAKAYVPISQMKLI
jgi:hypothetical protein